MSTEVRQVAGKEEKKDNKKQHFWGAVSLCLHHFKLLVQAFSPALKNCFNIITYGHIGINIYVDTDISAVGRYQLIISANRYISVRP